MLNKTFYIDNILTTLVMSSAWVCLTCTTASNMTRCNTARHQRFLPDIHSNSNAITNNIYTLTNQ